MRIKNEWIDVTVGREMIEDAEYLFDMMMAFLHQVGLVSSPPRGL